jgi:hypothetical protein
MVFLALLAAAAMAPGDGKTAALDDWHAMAILEVGGGSSPYYLRVKTGDLDGDGRADQAYLKLVCADGVLKQATYEVISPRDSASGQASGKRMHKPVTFVKEWGPATPQLSAVKPTYNVKNMQGSRLAADGWSPMTLGNADGLCPATAAAAAAIVRSKSNITNN